MDQKLIPLQEEFAEKCATLGVEATPEQHRLLLEYLSLLLKWNKAFNLTAITDPKQALHLHLLDSVAVSPAVADYDSLLDVGTGGGLPGIPLAILNPEKSFTLLDTNSKKTRFLKQAVFELGLSNVEVINARVQDISHQSGYACILSRAFASLEDMVSWTQALIAPNGHWLAMKGQYPEHELSELPASIEFIRSEKVKIPAVHAERFFIYLQQKKV